MDNATPSRSRGASVAVVVGWLLTVPGFLMIAGVLADAAGLLAAAGCRFNFNTGYLGCAPGILGNAMSVLQFFAVTTYFSVVMIIGAVPLLWSLIYPLVRWRRRVRPPAVPAAGA